MTGKTRTNSRRQIAIRTFNENLPIPDATQHREWRFKVLSEISAKCEEEYNVAPSPGCLGALYNEAKHIAIKQNLCDPFGRHGKGSNGSKKKELTEEELAKENEVVDASVTEDEEDADRMEIDAEPIDVTPDDEAEESSEEEEPEEKLEEESTNEGDDESK